MADIEKFSDDLGQAFAVVSAGKLDRNFQRCSPVKMDGDQAPYKVDVSDGGWKLLPTVTFDVCENGTPVQYRLIAERV